MVLVYISSSSLNFITKLYSIYKQGLVDHDIIDWSGNLIFRLSYTCILFLRCEISDRYLSSGE